MNGSGFYKFGQLAGKKFNKVKWMWNALAGNEAEAIRAEYEVGRDMAAVVRERTQFGNDTALQKMLDDTLDQLAIVVRNRLHRFDVSVVADEQATAYALPGGFIFLTHALLELCDRDRDEVAFVIAHEMAHVIRRHAINRVLRQTAYSAATMMAPGRGSIGPWLRRVGLEWLERAYSRNHEFEADALGALLTKAAGFDPHGGVRLFARFQRLNHGKDTSGLGTYLSSHPPVGDRMKRLRSRLAVADKQHQH